MGRVIDIRGRRPPETKVGLSISMEPGLVCFSHGDSSEIWEMPADVADRFATRLKAYARAARRAGAVADRRKLIRIVGKKE